MPLYEFRCRECDREFTLVLSLDEYGRKAHLCPRCQSKDVERVFGGVQVITAKKS